MIDRTTRINANRSRAVADLCATPASSSDPIPCFHRRQPSERCRVPEGPSIVILREEAAEFSGKVIRRAEGNAKIDMARIARKRVRAMRSFGKQFLIDLGSVSVRIHLLMYGSYRINERKEATPRLSLEFSNGELNLYSCSVRLIDGPLSDIYDWRGDLMSDAWDPALARKKLRAMPETLVCDALLDQEGLPESGHHED